MCELTLDAAGLDEYGQPKQPLPARKGVIIDCDDEFMHARERSFDEINAERLAHYERRRDALVWMRNTAQANSQSRGIR